MNVEIEAEAALFPEKEYRNGIFVAVCSDLSLILCKVFRILAGLCLLWICLIFCCLFMIYDDLCLIMTSLWSCATYLGYLLASACSYLCVYLVLPIFLYLCWPLPALTSVCFCAAYSGYLLASVCSDLCLFVLPI
jgi:hypothetical protein